MLTKRRFRSLVSGIVVSLVVLGAVELVNFLALDHPQFASLSELLQPTVASPTPAVLGEQLPAQTPKPINGERVVVKKVVDGDTVELENGQKVRYIGMDTPESKKPNTPVQCFAIEASKRNQELVEGKEVTLVKDVSDTDRYGRLLRYVFVGDQLINEQLVREGFAFARSYPPDIAKQAELSAAEAEARDSRKGLWAACTVVNEHTSVQ